MADVLIIGGSVAGLSAALLLARCRREVVICDEGLPRNRFSRHMHGFLSQEDIPPREFLQISRNQILEFPNVQFHRGRVESIRREEEGFVAETEGGDAFRSATVLLATGIVDELPRLPGIEPLYGRSVHHCPYCDGWEHRDEPLAIYGRGEAGVALARELLVWSEDVVYFSDGAVIQDRDREMLEKFGVRIIETSISSLEGIDGMLTGIKLSDGTTVPRSAMFFTGSQRQNADLAQQLGCDVAGEFVKNGKEFNTCVPGVYVAGNTTSGLQLAIVAAAEGARAAHAINTELMTRDAGV